MTNSPKVHALARLDHIADHGFCVISTAANEGLRLLATNHPANWTAKDFTSWSDTGDPVMTWFGENLGATQISDLEAGPLADICSKTGPATLISDLFSGARLGMILSHSKEALDEADVKEARAAALTLRMDDHETPDFEISAKELIYLEQVSKGATDDDIATDLQLSLRAVKERKRKAIDDLCAHNIGHAVGIAKRAKLI